MKREKSEVYLSTQEKSITSYKPNNFDELVSFLEQSEKDRLSRNESYISNLEKDLEYLDMMLVEEVKTIKDINQLEVLVKQRLRVLEKSISIADDKDRFQKSINSAIQLLEIIDAKKAVLQTDEVHDFDRKLFSDIYDYCTKETDVIDNTKSEFFRAVETANFSILRPKARGKGKIRNLIYCLKTMGMIRFEWYTQVVESLGITKSDCKYNAGNWNEGLEVILNQFKANRKK